MKIFGSGKNAGRLHVHKKEDAGCDERSGRFPIQVSILPRVINEATEGKGLGECFEKVRHDMVWCFHG